MIMDNALNPKHSSSFLPKQENAFSGFGSNVKAPKIEQNALAVDSGAPKQNFFNALMPVQPEPKPEKKKSVLGNIARGFAKGVNLGLYHDAKANYEYGQHMEQQAKHAEAQQFQDQRNQAIHGMGQLAYNLKQFGSSEERMAEAAKFAQSNGLPIPTDINEFSDDALDGQMNQAVLAGWQMPQAAERKIIEGADGYQYYQDGSRVLPNVVKEEEAQWQTLTPEQVKQANLDPSRQWQISPDKKIVPIGGQGKPAVQVNLPSNKQETSYAAQIGKQAGESRGNIMEAGTNAQKNMSDIAAMETALDMVDYTGFAGDTILGLQKAGSFLGLDVGDDIAPKEVAQRLTAKMGLALKTDLPGPMSDGDRDFLLSIPPNINMSPEANDAMLYIMRKRNQFEIDMANSLYQANPRSYEEYDSWERNFRAGYGELFTPEDRMEIMNALSGGR